MFLKRHKREQQPSPQLLPSRRGASNIEIGVWTPKPSVQFVIGAVLSIQDYWRKQG
jgi:hypothetical protein